MISTIVLQMKKNKFFLTLIVIVFASSQALAEFKSFTKKEFLQNNMQVLEKRFDRIDANKDGTVDANEYKAWTQRITQARQQQMLQLKKADLNKDNKIDSYEEARGLAVEKAMARQNRIKKANGGSIAKGCGAVMDQKRKVTTFS